MTKLYFCVVEDYQGQINVCSYGGRNKTEEKRFAASGNKAVYLVTLDHVEAQREAARRREMVNRAASRSYLATALGGRHASV
jgi:hypothetical protein